MMIYLHFRENIPIAGAGFNSLKVLLNFNISFTLSSKLKSAFYNFFV